MARPTRAEQEKKRIAELFAEGKGPDGQPISDAEVLSETKNDIPKTDPGALSDKNSYSISELEQEITNSTLGNGGSDEPRTGFDMNSGNANAPNTEDPNYVKTSGHDRFRDEIIVNESDANRAATGNPSVGNDSNPPPPPPPESKDFAEPIINGASHSETIDDKDKKDEPMNPALDDLSPTEKRKQVEMFADAILETYGQLYHAAFSGYCSVKMNKMEVLDRDGTIRLSMVIERGENGEMTIREQFLKYNEKVNDAFTVTPEMKEQLREPLIAVLMEKGIAPTPMTTLLIVAGSHLLQGIFNAAQLKAEIKEQTETFKQFRSDEIQKEIDTHKNLQNRGPNNSSATGPKKEATVVSMNEVLKADNIIKPVEIKSESNETPESTNNSGISMEDIVGKPE